MSRGIRLRLVLLLLAILGWAAREVDAGHPTYLLLQSPAAGSRHGPQGGDWPAYGQPVSTSPYAYGWFGAKPCPQWSRHFGYHRNYTQWSSR